MKLLNEFETMLVSGGAASSDWATNGGTPTIELPPVTITGTYGPGNSSTDGAEDADYTASVVLYAVGAAMDIGSKALGAVPLPQAKAASAVLWVGAWGAKGLAGALAVNTAVLQ